MMAPPSSGLANDVADFVVPSPTSSDASGTPSSVGGEGSPSGTVTATATPKSLRHPHQGQQPRNNYAGGHNTPIASAKRPRTPGHKTPRGQGNGKTPTNGSGSGAAPRTPGAWGGGGGAEGQLLLSPTAEGTEGLPSSLGSMATPQGPKGLSSLSFSTPAVTNSDDDDDDGDDEKETPMKGSVAEIEGGGEAQGTPMRQPPPTPGPPAGALSPMHPVRPMRSRTTAGTSGEVGAEEKEVVAEDGGTEEGGMEGEEDKQGGHGWTSKLFSPVLNFLGGAGGGEEEGEGKEEDNGEVKNASVGKGDVTVDLDEDGDVEMEDAVDARDLTEEAKVGTISKEETIKEEEEEVQARAEEEAPTAAEAIAAERSGVDNDAANDYIYESYQVPSPSSCASEGTAHSDFDDHHHHSNEDDEDTGDRHHHRHHHQREDHQEHHHHHQECEQQQEQEEEDEEEEFNPYLFIKSLPLYRSVVPHPHRRVCLPPKCPADPPIALVLDLDETLVHCTVEPTPDADMVFPVVFNGVEYRVHVRCRPYLEEFLRRVSRDFEVIVFTASQKVYADELLDRIDPGECLCLL